MKNGTTDKQRGIENLIRRALKQNKLKDRNDVKNSTWQLLFLAHMEASNY